MMKRFRMQYLFGSLLFLSIALGGFLGCTTKSVPLGMWYEVALTLENTQVTASVLVHNPPPLCEYRFKIDKSFQGLQVLGEGLGSIEIDSLNAYENLVRFTLTGSRETQLRFTYQIPLDKVLVDTPVGKGVELQGSRLLPVVYTTAFEPLTYRVDLHNQSTFDWLSNFSLEKLHTTDKIVQTLSEKPFQKIETSKGVIWYVDKGLPIVQGVSNEFSGVLDFYNSIFKDSVSDFSIVINDYGSYSHFTSEKFLSLSVGSSPAFSKEASYGQGYYYGVLFHELAHHWFSFSRVFQVSSDAFLDEGFADYLSYMYLRELYGQDYFQELIQKCQDFAVNSPSILQVDQFSSEQDRVVALYVKGSLLAYELELYLGREQFELFLNLLLHNSPGNIPEFIYLIEHNYDPAVLSLVCGLLNA